MCKLSILILTKNEEQSIAQQILSLKMVLSEFPQIEPRIALVDDSSDATRKIAKDMGLEVIEGGGRGLGYAYSQGLGWIKNNPSDFVMSFDGDGQVDISEFKEFWNLINTADIDMVISSRFKNNDTIKYNYPRMNRFGVLMLSNYLSFFSGQRFTDSHGGLRLFSWEVASNMEVKAIHSYVQVSTLSIIRQGYKVIEVSSIWKKRDFGESRVVHSKLKYFKRMFFPLIAEGLRCLPYRLKYAFK